MWKFKVTEELHWMTGIKLGVHREYKRGKKLEATEVRREEKKQELSEQLLRRTIYS